MRGQVLTQQGPDANAAVIVFPTDEEAWGSSGSSRRVRMLRTSRTGEYSLNLPPGDYFAIAVPDAQAADWQDRAFLDAARRSAARVSISEGERAVQDLRTREVR